MSRSLASKINSANAALMTMGDIKSIGEYFARDYIAHVTEKDLKGGHAVVKKILSEYRRAFSGLKVEVEILAQNKDRIAWQRTVRAKHTGNFKGFPATGRKIAWRDMVVSRFRNGLIAEDWVINDLAERLMLARKR